MSHSSKEPSVPRILIVENEPGTVRNLENKLHDAIPGVVVESAGTVMDGQNLVVTADANQRPYDVVILDFKLPENKDDPEEGDFLLGFLLGRLCPDTLVIHMTAWPDAPDFQRVRPAPNTRAAAHRLYFGKGEYDWAKELVAACAKYIIEKSIHFHSNRIRAEFERLFGIQDDSTLVFRSTGRSSSGRGDRARSLEIAVFCDDAGEHWNDLDATLQRDLADAMGHAQDTEGYHYVGVVSDFSPDSNAGKGEAT